MFNISYNGGAICRVHNLSPNWFAYAGLDSTNAATVVDILAELSAKGVNVIMSIHQPRPDVFRLIDRVLLFSGSGQARALRRKHALVNWLHSNHHYMRLDAWCLHGPLHR